MIKTNWNWLSALSLSLSLSLHFQKIRLGTCLVCLNGSYDPVVIGKDKSCVVKSHRKSNNKYKQGDVIQMLHFWSTTYLSSLVD